MIPGGLPVELRRSLELWVGSVAAALTEAECLALLAEVGFEAVPSSPCRSIGSRMRAPSSAPRDSRSRT